MNLRGIQLLSTGHLLPDPQWKMTPHLHPMHELIVPLMGRMRVESGGRRLDAAAGDVLLYPAEVLHAEWADAAAPVESLFLGFRAGAWRSTRVIMAQDNAGRMRQLIRWIHEDCNSSVPHIRKDISILLRALLLEFFRKIQHREDPLILRMRQYIQAHIADKLTLEVLARQANKSKYHFLRTYKALTGRTPMEDTRIIRANYARELILSTNLPLKEIAPRSGLGNEYAMSRVFRRQFNIPPGEWRRHRTRKSETKEWSQAKEG